jgi:hypothetical protein
MNEEIEIKATTPKARVLKFITIVSSCKLGSMQLMEGSKEIEHLLSNGWKVKRGK